MTARGFYTLLAGCVLVITALSVGSEGAFLLGCAALLALAVSLVSVLLAACTCRLTQHTESDKVVRREPIAYSLSVRMFSAIANSVGIHTLVEFKNAYLLCKDITMV